MHACIKTINGLASSPSSTLVQTRKEGIFSAMDARYGGVFFMKAMDLIDCMIAKQWFPSCMRKIHTKQW